MKMRGMAAAAKLQATEVVAITIASEDYDYEIGDAALRFVIVIVILIVIPIFTCGLSFAPARAS